MNTIKPIILLVDDNEDILTFLSCNMMDKYTVLTARNGQEALKQLGEASVHLVITDVMMPVMDGFELCRLIKSDFAFSHIPVIMLTAKNTLQSKIEGLETGADAYIEKPFSPAHLLAQVASLLSNRSKVREHFASSPLAHIKTMATSRADEQFLEKLHGVIYANIENKELHVDLLADLMNMSRATLYRKIKEVTNLSPNELINLARLKKAAELLAEDDYKIYEVSEMVGFSSHRQLARNFQRQFQISPSEYNALKRSERKLR